MMKTDINILNSERRQDDRAQISLDSCDGTFTLEVLDEEYEITEILDISLSGIGIEMPIYLDPGRPVKLFYEEDDLEIEVTGTVTWCSEDVSTTGGYRLGILFDYSYRDQNSMLFMAVRKFLDDFDGGDVSES
ncbi:MAG: PilZ domain-containing protein [Gammaproteobacteria bacterium]